MAKLFFISDIHGSAHCTRLALDAFHSSGADYLVILGDILYHGPRNPLPEGHNPQEVASLLNPLADRIMAVRGNCDSEVDEMVLDFPVLATYSSMLLGSRRLFLTHGHIYHEMKMPPLRAGDVFASGHVHLPVAQQKEGIWFFNPGSVALPKGGHPNSYGLMDETGMQVIAFDGTVLASAEF